MPFRVPLNFKVPWCCEMDPGGPIGHEQKVDLLFQWGNFESSQMGVAIVLKDQGIILIAMVRVLCLVF